MSDILLFISFLTSSSVKPIISLNFSYLVISVDILNPDVRLSKVIGLTPVANILCTIDSVPIFKTSYHFLIKPVLLTRLENKSVLKLIVHLQNGHTHLLLYK